jgi:pyruvate dehydrogenase E2 component (dihydrolipoamide acetyltransferase)
MPTEITMPQLSDTMTEGTVLKWLKREGDKVRAGEVIAEVETDKANMEMEAFEGGTLAHIVVKEGDKAQVGGAIAILASAGENPADVKKQYVAGGAGAANAGKAREVGGSVGQAAQKAASAATFEGQEHVPPPAPGSGAVVTMESASVSEIHEVHDAGHGATREDISTEPPKGGNGHHEGGRIFASPLARRIAADKGLDLSQIKGTGPGGRIVQKDVLEAAENGSAAAPAPAPQSAPAAAGAKPAAPTPMPQRIGTGQQQVIPLTKMRATIAQRLQAAKQQIPHVYFSVDVDMENVNALRERINKQLEAEKIRVSVADFVAKAVAVTLQRHPAMNAHFDEKNQQIIRFGDVHLGNAVALPDGLIVPVLRNVDQMGLKEIRQRSVDLFDRAKAQRLKRDEMTGATFTITNLGLWGIREFMAIVNPPEVGILAVSTAEPRPVVRNGQIVPRTMMTCTLSADHRAIDGAVAAAFMKTFKAVLEEPGMMLV